jgi:predicted kinase
MNKLYVMRGLPGSGKTSWIKANIAGASISSADHYFYTGGEYHFNGKLLKQAHDECFQSFQSFVDAGHQVVAVDNTNLSYSEGGRYIEYGLKHDYEVTVIDLQISPETAATRNVHGVTAPHIERMAKKKLLVPELISKNPNFHYVTKRND